MLRAPNSTAWPATLSAVLKLLHSESVVAPTAGEADEIFAQDWEEQGFQTSFSVLGASAAPTLDPAAFAGADTRAYVAAQLAQASATHPEVSGFLEADVRVAADAFKPAGTPTTAASPG